MNESNIDKTLILLLRMGCFLCFAGWTWTHFYWESPYTTLLWHDSTYELAQRFGISWDQFVGSGANDGLIQKWVPRIGWLYLACAVLSLTARKGAWLQLTGLVGGSVLLAILSYAKYVGSGNQLPMFVEHGGQMLCPSLLVLALSLGAQHRITVYAAMVAMVMTFAGHGCFAVGLWPTPATFYGMTSVILGVQYETATVLLMVAGVLDFLVCVGIWIPWVRRPCALYAAVWGTLTALARPVAGMSWALNYWGADQFVHEVVLRAPHFMIPCYLFFHWRGASGPNMGDADRADGGTQVRVTETECT